MPARRASGPPSFGGLIFPHVCSGGRPGRRFRCGQELTMSESSQPNPLATDAAQADEPSGFLGSRADHRRLWRVARRCRPSSALQTFRPGHGTSAPFPALAVRRGVAVCGARLVWEARTGGYREASAPGGHPRADIGAFVWKAHRPAGQRRTDRHRGLHRQLHRLLRAGRRACAALAARPRRGAPITWVSTGQRAVDLGTRVLGLHAIPATNLPGLTETGWLHGNFDDWMAGFATAITPANLLWAHRSAALRQQDGQEGRAGAALATSAIGSFVAGTVATVVVTLFAPSVADFAVKLGPPEYFMLMVLAFTTVSAVLGCAALAA
ncbi:hypothetical protein MM560_G450n37 [Manis javanica]|nr:hypothetical protein MM560_G450n37 [Manis javanica]